MGSNINTNTKHLTTMMIFSLNSLVKRGRKLNLIFFTISDYKRSDLSLQGRSGKREEVLSLAIGMGHLE